MRLVQYLTGNAISSCLEADGWLDPSTAFQRQRVGETGLVLGREQILLPVLLFAKQGRKSYVQQLKDDVRL
jgi:hypothetical protein